MSGDVCRVNKLSKCTILLALLVMVAAACDSVDMLMQDLQTGSGPAKEHAVNRLVIHRAVGPLTTALKNSDPIVRRLAAEGLGRINDPRVVEPLIVALGDPESKVRRQAAKSLGKFRGPRAVEPLIAALKDPDSRVRQNAAEALGEFGGARAVGPLIAALEDPDPDVLRPVTKAIASIGSPAVDPLIAALKNPKSQVRQSAAEALYKVGDARAMEPLIAALKDPESKVRQYAAEALGQIGDIRAVEPLIVSLRDPDPDVRIPVNCALGRIGDARAVDPLIAALKDPVVRGSAACALSEIGDSIAVPALVENLVYWPSRKEVGDALTSFSWKPRTEEEQVHFWVAKSDASSLISQWSLAKKVLLQDVQSGNKDRIGYALFAFISIGKEDIIPELVQIMRDRGNKELAEAYLNCGRSELNHAAEEWAARHGYKIVKGGGFAPVVWGRRY